MGTITACPCACNVRLGTRWMYDLFLRSCVHYRHVIARFSVMVVGLQKKKGRGKKKSTEKQNRKRVETLATNVHIRPRWLIDKSTWSL